MEESKRKSVMENLNVFDYLAKDNDYIQVTEWSNGDGWDFDISGKTFSLTHRELDAILYLTLHLTNVAK